MKSQPGNHGNRQVCRPECEVTTPYPWRSMTVANAVWCHNPLIVATMYSTHQGVNHASGVTHMLYYIIVIIIIIIITTTTTTAIFIIVTSKLNIASFDVLFIIVYHQDAIHLGYEAASLSNQFSAYRSVFVHTGLE